VPGPLLVVSGLHRTRAQASGAAVQDVEHARVGRFTQVLTGSADDQVGAAVLVVVDGVNGFTEVVVALGPPRHPVEVLVDFCGALAVAVHDTHQTGSGVAADGRLRVGDGDVLDAVTVEVGDTKGPDLGVHPGGQVVDPDGDAIRTGLSGVRAVTAPLVRPAGKRDHLMCATGGAHHRAARV